MAFKNHGPGGCCCGCVAWVDEFNAYGLWVSNWKPLEDTSWQPATYVDGGPNRWMEKRPNTGQNADCIYQESGNTMTCISGLNSWYTPKHNGHFFYPGDAPINFDVRFGVKFKARARVKKGGLVFGCGSDGAGYGFFDTGYVLPVGGRTNYGCVCRGEPVTFNTTEWFDIEFEMIPNYSESWADGEHDFTYLDGYTTKWRTGTAKIHALDIDGNEFEHIGPNSCWYWTFQGTNVMYDSPFHSLRQDVLENSNWPSYSVYLPYNNCTSYSYDGDPEWELDFVEYSQPGNSDFNPARELSLAITQESGYTGRQPARDVADCPHCEHILFPINYIKAYEDGGVYPSVARPTVRLTSSNANAGPVNRSDIRIFGKGDREAHPFIFNNSGAGMADSTSTQYFDQIYGTTSDYWNVPWTSGEIGIISKYYLSRRFVTFDAPGMLVVSDLYVRTWDSSGASHGVTYVWFLGQEGRRTFDEMDFSYTDPDYCIMFGGNGPTPEEMWNASGNMRFKVSLL